jgi:Flp pilus assembly secretin CpaC
LNETVEDRTFSKTPLLGDIPAIGTVFNERNSLQRQDSVLVLVTPASPTILAGRPWSRPTHVQRLTALWTQVIDPASDAASTVERLQRNRLFTRMTRADVYMAFPPAREVVPEMLGQLLGTGGA